jgi:FMN-dependent NADH-azoreductase
MTKLLFVKSSLAGTESRSIKVANELIAALRAQNGQMKVAERDVSGAAIPHLSSDFLAALATPPVHRTARQHMLAKAADGLLEEVEAADVIVIAAPMYNFSIPSTLHVWLDHITRAGRTFRYTAEGKPEGLLKNKQVYVVTARGGIYTGDSPAKVMDFQEPYLRAMLAFNGLTEVRFIHVEGQTINPAVAEQGLQRARAEIANLLPAMASAA